MSITLHVKVIEATDVPKVDVLSESDPYCVMQMTTGVLVGRTPTIDNCPSPRWDSEFHFPVRKIGYDELHAVIKDYDVASKDDEICRTVIKLGDLRIGEISDRWIDMEPCGSCNGGTRLHIVLQLLFTGMTAWVPPEA